MSMAIANAAKLPKPWLSFFPAGGLYQQHHLCRSSKVYSEQWHAEGARVEQQSQSSTRGGIQQIQTRDEVWLGAK